MTLTLLPGAVWLALATLAGGCQAQSAANLAGDVAPDALNDNNGAVVVLIGLALVPVLMFVVRRLLIARVKRQMLVASADQRTADNQEAWAREEMDAPVMPQLSLHEADLAAPGGSVALQRHEQAARRLLRLVCLADLGIALGYALLPMLFGLAQTGDAAFDGAAPVGLFIGLIVAAFTVIRYLIQRRQFRAFNLRRTRKRQAVWRFMAGAGRVILVLLSIVSGATVYNLTYVPEILRGIFGSRLRTILSLLLIVGTVVGALSMITGDGPAGDRAVGVGFLAAAILHFGIFSTLARRMRRVAGPRLLILRVFNIDETSSFIFSGLMRYWRHFGNHFTVVDASLVRQGYSNSTWKTVFLLFVSWAALGLAAMGLADPADRALRASGFSLTTGWVAVLTALLAVTSACALWAIGVYRIDRRFMRNTDQVQARLDRLEARPRLLDLSFRHIRALCHDNTWFPAVAAFTRRANVVLMDLRGYSDQRKGCQREVDFLFDSCPLSHLLFLMDTSNEQQLVADMLFARWQRLHRNSPNLTLSAPVIHLYLARDNDERDMQAILDRLVEMADAPPPPTLPQIQEDEGQENILQVRIT